ncbi:hypothetical protein [Gilvimarinus xylanilyticus]|uniref:Uncharacterized protein n=1 Tax=Gilvimarinus xylanilyticus TaxID=2944139 RepID=A0A9X2KSP9_9GAMM|nr:hypothetical protein [Gilvimarinus xylanilyticus]MCP8898469.1 hypothetical protein [Gilvimarinus xylanilyticus]
MTSIIIINSEGRQKLLFSVSGRGWDLQIKAVHPRKSAIFPKAYFQPAKSTPGQAALGFCGLNEVLRTA